MIMLADVKKSYDREVVLQNFTMTVSKGEFAFITGPSGAGKSTLLKLLYCYEHADSGHIAVDNWIVSQSYFRTSSFYATRLSLRISRLPCVFITWNRKRSRNGSMQFSRT
jgi:ABC-type ATPase involved in cell division